MSGTMHCQVQLWIGPRIFARAWPPTLARLPAHAPPRARRPLLPGDLSRLKQLHRQLFPIDYDQSFFHQAVHGLAGILSWVACLPLPAALSLPCLTQLGGRPLQHWHSAPSPEHIPGGQQWQQQKQQQHQLLPPQEWHSPLAPPGWGGGMERPAPPVSLPSLPNLPSLLASEPSSDPADPGEPWSPRLESPGGLSRSTSGIPCVGLGGRDGPREELVGFITARPFPLAQIDPSDRQRLGLANPAFDSEEAVYILTLGVDEASLPCRSCCPMWGSASRRACSHAGPAPPPLGPLIPGAEERLSQLSSAPADFHCLPPPPSPPSTPLRRATACAALPGGCCAWWCHTLQRRAAAWSTST